MYRHKSNNMKTRIQKWGNSQGVRVAKEILTELQLKDGQMVDVFVKDGMIVISKTDEPVPSLQELVANIPDFDVVRTEGQFGEPIGKEIW